MDDDTEIFILDDIRMYRLYLLTCFGVPSSLKSLVLHKSMKLPFVYKPLIVFNRTDGGLCSLLTHVGNGRGYVFQKS